MRKSIIFAWLIISFLTSFIEYVNNFQYTKNFSTLIGINNKIYADTLVNNRYLVGGSNLGPITYTGNSIKRFKEYKITVRHNTPSDSIIVWYFPLSDSVIQKDSDEIPSPFSIAHLEYLIGTLNLLFLLPLLIYNLILRRKK